MALVTVGSISIQDATGDTKSLALYFPASASLADISLFLGEFAVLLNNAIDGVIKKITIAQAITLPNGLRTTPVNDQTVHEGALLNFSVANSSYSQGYYIPSWQVAGFSGKSILNSTPYSLVINALMTHSLTSTVGPSSEEGNDLIAYLRGSRRVRK